MKYYTLFFSKIGTDVVYLSSAAVVIDALRVNNVSVRETKSKFDNSGLIIPNLCSRLYTLRCTTEQIITLIERVCLGLSYYLLPDSFLYHQYGTVA